MSIATVGCGAGAPLLYPVHPLEGGAVRGAVGASTTLLVGETKDAFDDARLAGTAPEAIAASDQERFVEGSVVQAISTPEMAPFVAVRGGLGGENEMGITYTGRRVRADLRHAFPIEDFAFSVGGGIGALLPDPGENQPRTSAGEAREIEGDGIGRFDGGSISGFTLDVPILFGWQSTPRLVDAWFGARGTYERFSADFIYDFDSAAKPVVAPADGNRFVAGGVLGLSVGLRPVRAMLELGAGYQTIEGDVAGLGSDGSGSVTTRLDGLVLTPAFALAVDLD